MPILSIFLPFKSLQFQRDTGVWQYNWQEMKMTVSKSKMRKLQFRIMFTSLSLKYDPAYEKQHKRKKYQEVW